MTLHAPCFDARKKTFSSPSAGALLGTFQTPATVRLKKASIEAQVRAIDASLQSVSISPGTLAGWNSFAKGWAIFRDAPEGFLTAGWEMDQAENYERQVADWQKLLAELGARGIPILKPSSSNLDWGTTFEKLKPWILVAAAIYFGAILIPALAPAIGTAAAALVKPKK